MARSRWAVPVVTAVAVVASACNSSTPTGGDGGPVFTQGAILVLNSLSRTVQQFNISENELVPFGSTLNLPANFDGVTMDVLENLLVTTISSFGGSQVVWVDIGTGETITTGFGGTNGALADPGKPTLVIDTGGTVGALVPARGENRVYISFPGTPNGILIAENIGEYVERVLPFGLLMYTVDANLDDVGGTFAPLGDAGMKVFRFNDGSEFDSFSLPGAMNVTDALFSREQIMTVAGGTFVTDPVFGPAGDGKVVVVNAPDRGIRETRDLEGNGLSFEFGRNGLGYIVRTQGSFDQTDILTFNFFSENFDNGPANPIQPKNADGSNLNECRTATGLLDSRIVCATFEAGTQGRLVLMAADGTFIDDALIGAGATDIFVR